MWLSSTAAEPPVKFQSETIISILNIAALSLYNFGGKASYSVVNWNPVVVAFPCQAKWRECHRVVSWKPYYSLHNLIAVTHHLQWLPRIDETGSACSTFDLVRYTLIPARHLLWWAWNSQDDLGQYYGYWCPGDAWRQGMRTKNVLIM